MPKTTRDFGEKIGGARKDLWGARGLLSSDLDDMNEAEEDKFVTKNNIWNKPDYQKLRDEGIPKDLVYYIKIVRDGIAPKRPAGVSYADYIDGVRQIQDFVESLHTETDILLRDFPDFKYCVHAGLNDSLLDNTTWSYKRKYKQLEKRHFVFTELELAATEFFPVPQMVIKQDATDKDFLELHKLAKDGHIVAKYRFLNKSHIDADSLSQSKYAIFNTKHEIIETDVSADSLKETLLRFYRESHSNEKSQSKALRTKKKRIVYSVLENVTMHGVDYRHGHNVTGDDIMNAFGIRGGEFGNWLNDKDTQLSLNHAYDSLMNIAVALEIDPKDVGLNGKLALAFGARGHSSALAHYEPERQVINLTRLKGAGSLAHEWIHAQDNILASAITDGRVKGTMMLSDHSHTSSTPDVVTSLVDSLSNKIVTGDAKKKWCNEQVETAEAEFMTHLDSLIQPARYTGDDIDLLHKYQKAVLEEIRTDTSYRYALGNNKFDKSFSEASQILNDFQIAHGDKTLKFNVQYLNFQRAQLASSIEKYTSMDLNEPVKALTKFFLDAEKMDRMTSHTGHGYWTSTIEMLARAGACYIDDKLAAQGIQDAYLTGHARSGHIENEELSSILYYPIESEQKQINEAFDKYVQMLKDKGIMHHMDAAKIIEQNQYVSPIEKYSDRPVEYHQNQEQLSFDSLFDSSNDQSSRIHESSSTYSSQSAALTPKAYFDSNVQLMNIQIFDDGNKESYYNPMDDTIHLPKPEVFENDDTYYVVGIHELLHATSAKHRLNRDLYSVFGFSDYIYEDMIIDHVEIPLQLSDVVQQEYRQFISQYHHDSQTAFVSLDDSTKDKVRNAAEQVTHYLNGITNVSGQKLHTALVHVTNHSNDAELHYSKGIDRGIGD